MDIIIIQDNSYIFHGEKFRETDINDIVSKMLGKKFKIIILGENILIKVCENVKSKIKEHIENTVMDNLIIDEDTLIDYKYDRKSQKVYIYSIKNGIRIIRIIKEAEDVKIIPIQYIIRDILNRKVRVKESYKAIIKYGDYIYLIDIENKHITSSIVISSRGYQLNKLIETNLSKRKVIVDSELKEYISNCTDNVNITFVDLREKISNEISKVQGFFARNIKG